MGSFEPCRDVIAWFIKKVERFCLPTLALEIVETFFVSISKPILLYDSNALSIASLSSSGYNLAISA